MESGINEIHSLIDTRAYRVWYQTRSSLNDYEVTLIKMEGQLYHWPETTDWLTDIIRNTIDPLCETATTFIETTKDLWMEAHYPGQPGKTSSHPELSCASVARVADSKVSTSLTHIQSIPSALN